jgi:hypothetical protein
MKNIEFNYMEYWEKVSEKIKKKYESSELLKTIVIFDGIESKNEFIKNSFCSFLNNDILFFTLDEIKEKIFVTSRILISNDNSFFLLYDMLSSEKFKQQRTFLKIDSYFDFKEFGINFFDYFRDINIYKINKISNIYKWQEDHIKIYNELKAGYDEILDANNYLPEIWLDAEENFNDEFLKHYEKIIFVDIDDFPRLYVDIIKNKLSFMDIEFYMQIAKNNYDEENLKIRDVDLPDIDDDRIKTISLYNVEGSKKSMFSLAGMLTDKNENRENTYIFSPDVTENKYHEIFPNLFQSPSDIKFIDTELFEFLDVFYEIIESSEIIEKDENGYKNKDEKYDKKLDKKDGKIIIKLNSIMKAFDSKIFRIYYVINNRSKNILYEEILRRNYQFISSEILDDILSKKLKYGNGEHFIKFKNTMESILNDIETLYKCDNTKVFIGIFKNMVFKNIKPEKENNFLFYNYKNKNMFSAINEALNDLYRGSTYIEKIDKDNIGKFLYGYLFEKLSNLSFKADITGESVYRIEDAYNARFNKYKYEYRNRNTDEELSNKSKSNSIGYFLDVINDNYPKVSKNKSIFTNNQLKTFGMPTDDDLRNIEKKKFLQNIFAFNNIVFFTYADESEKIEFSPFIEEIKLRYGIKEKAPMDNKIYLEFLKNKFMYNDNNNKENNKEERPEFSLEKEDNSVFNNGMLKLGAYDLNNLTKCNLAYYFSNIKNIDEVSYNDNLELLTPLYIGNLLHDGMEEILKATKEKLENGDFSINERTIIDIFGQIINEDISKKIPEFFAQYYLDIIVPKFVRNIKIFYKEMEIKYKGKKIKNINIEEKAESKENFLDINGIKAQLSGKVDLWIEFYDTDPVIYDHKTGNSTEGQLEFYSVALFGDSQKAEKYIFNVWDGEIKDANTDKITKESIENTIRDFIINKKLMMALPNNKGVYINCRDCQYKKICNRG